MKITQESVERVFQSVPSVYDLMNTLMSVGLHHTWKDMLVNQLPLTVACEYKILDLATGTGDIAARLQNRAQRDHVNLSLTACDASQEMLQTGRARYPKAAWRWCVEDARALSFVKESFDGCTISFGLRNVLPFYKGLQEIYRVLKPGGFFFCLELSHPVGEWMELGYQAYCALVIPLLAKFIAQDSASYRYLIESIERFPKADLLEQFMQQCGFERTGYRLISGGVVALHWGYKGKVL